MSSYAVHTPDGATHKVASHHLPRVGEDLVLPDPETGQSVYVVPKETPVYRVLTISHPTKEDSTRAYGTGIHVPMVRVRELGATERK